MLNKCLDSVSQHRSEEAREDGVPHLRPRDHVDDPLAMHDVAQNPQDASLIVPGLQGRSSSNTMK